jgi:hypothetical protein
MNWNGIATILALIIDCSDCIDNARNVVYGSK